MIDLSWNERLFAYMGAVARDADCSLLSAGGMPDHVHLLLRMHPTRATADLMRNVKAASSKWVHETFHDSKGFGWQDGYAAFSVSQSAVGRVQSYIARQAEHHRRVSFQEELIAFLEEQEVEFDRRYLFA